MAVDAPALYNGWWVYLRDMTPPYGSTHLNPTEMQIVNAYKMRTALQLQGYCDKAIAGVVGNAQKESGLTTGAIYAWSRLPNNGESLAECTTDYMYQYYQIPQGSNGPVGLLQWNGHDEGTNNVIAFAKRYGLVWYDGDTQMYLLQREFETGSTWQNNYGPNLTWAVYKDIENSQFASFDAGECGNVWASCFEISSTDPSYRQDIRDNSNYWYQYFIDHPNPPPGPFDLPIWLLYAFKRNKQLKNYRRYI